MSFAQLAHYLLIAKPLKMKSEKEREEHRNFLQNSVLIIDEVHSIFKPLPNQRLEHDALKKLFLNVNDERMKGLKLFILTATPGDSPETMVGLLNMIRRPSSSPIRVPNVDNLSELNEFRKNIRGLISFYDASGDITRFPKVNNNIVHKTHMTEEQFKMYLEKFNNMPEKSKSYQNLKSKDQLQKYYESARKYSNFLLNYEDTLTINEISAKLSLLIDNIKKYPNEKHYIYSAFYSKMGKRKLGQGIMAIAHFLEKELKYSKLSVSKAKDVLKEKNDNVSKHLSKDKRYCLAVSTELSKNASANPKAAGENLDKLRRVYNSASNKNGDYLHIIIASQGYNEGLDLRGVRHIHMFEPFITMTQDKQAIGRGARFCSHSDLPLSDWNVNIHRYFALNPTIESSKDKISDLEKEYKNLEEKKNTIENEIKRYDNTIEKLKKSYDNELDNFKKMLEKEENEYKAIDRKTKIKKGLPKAYKDHIRYLKDKMKERTSIKNNNINLLKKEKTIRKNELSKFKKESEKRMKQITSEIKKLKELEEKLKNVKSVDELVYKEAYERAKTMDTLHKTLKEEATDCIIFQKFHSQTGENIQCSNY